MNERYSKTLAVPGDELLALSHDLANDGVTLSYRSQPAGESMWPFIRAGDQIFVEHVPENSLRVNDVIVFRHPAGGALIAHRLLRMEHTAEGMLYRTRGDALRMIDPPVRFAGIVGRVNRILRRGNTINLQARSTRMLVRVWLAMYPLPQLARAGFRKLFIRRQ